MQIVPLLLRYWYLWMISIVLTTAALSGFRNSMEIEVNGTTFSMRMWQVLLAFDIFLLLIGAVYLWLDLRAIAFPRWVRIGHLAISCLFTVCVFGYLQVLLGRRLDMPRSYFPSENTRYWEDLGVAAYGFIVLFGVAQVVFLFYLGRAWWRRRVAI